MDFSKRVRGRVATLDKKWGLTAQPHYTPVATTTAWASSSRAAWRDLSGGLQFSIGREMLLAEEIRLTSSMPSLRINEYQSHNLNPTTSIVFLHCSSAQHKPRVGTGSLHFGGSLEKFKRNFCINACYVHRHVYIAWPLQCTHHLHRR